MDLLSIKQEIKQIIKQEKKEHFTVIDAVTEFNAGIQDSGKSTY